jgi:hypothetical protein
MKSDMEKDLRDGKRKYFALSFPEKSVKGAASFKLCHKWIWGSLVSIVSECRLDERGSIPG